jgi:hypothetical protein
MEAGAAAHDRLAILLEHVLAGGTRAAIVDRALEDGPVGRALRRLRRALASHRFETGNRTVELAEPVAELDRRTREEGFHVLQAWDFQEQRFTEDNIAVLMLDFALREELEADRTTLEILLDHYFLHLLALLAMRVWDTSDPDGALDRVGLLLERLQGGEGSGHRFVDRPESLLMLAVSYFHPEEAAYDRLIDRVRTLGEEHRSAFAFPSAAALGSHLRWGMAVMYGWDVKRMRDDNVGDYPWLLFSVATLLGAYEDRIREDAGGEARSELVHGLLHGLGADPWAFVGAPPPALQPYAQEHAACRELLRRHRDRLLEDFRAHRPRRDGFAPLAFHFNFPNNVLVASVTVALLRGRPLELPMDALFGAAVPGADDEARLSMALELMEYAGSSPERLDAHGARLVAYAPEPALRAFNLTLGALKKL